MSVIYTTITDSVKSLPFYLTSIGLYFEESKISRPQGYFEYQWLQTISGEGEITFNNSTYRLPSGTGLIIPANIPHSYSKVSQHWITHWVSFNGLQLSNLFDTIGFSNIHLFNRYDSFYTTNLLESIFEKAQGNYHKESLSISSKIHLLIEYIYSCQQIEHNEKLSINSQLNLLMDYIDQYFMMDLTIEELSRVINVSPQYLCRLFKHHLTLRPFEYINQVRISKSKNLLLSDSASSIEETCYSVGFHSPSYFSSIFKKYEKITPRQFIQLHQRGV